MSFERIAGKVAKMDPRVTDNSVHMIESIKEAREALHRAQQFGRTLSTETSTIWITDQLDSVVESVSDFLKSAESALDYMNR